MLDDNIYNGKLVCYVCNYSMDFGTSADVITYLGGRGRLYGWDYSFNPRGERQCKCPMCISSGTKSADGLILEQDDFEDKDDYELLDPYILQMRLEMFR